MQLLVRDRGVIILPDLMLIALLALPQLPGFASCIALLVAYIIFLNLVIYLIAKAKSLLVIFEPLFVVCISIGVPLTTVLISPLLLAILTLVLVGPNLEWPTVAPELIRSLSFAIILLRRLAFRCHFKTVSFLTSKISERNAKHLLHQRHWLTSASLVIGTLLAYFALPSWRFLGQYFLLAAICNAYIFSIPYFKNPVKRFVGYGLFLYALIYIFNNQSFVGAFEANRTALLYPASISLICEYLKFRLNKQIHRLFTFKSTTLWLNLSLVALFLTIALYFASSKFWDNFTSPLSAFYSVYLDPSQGLARINNYIEYVSLKGSVLGLQPFINLVQLITVFYPRQLFPDKPSYDISVLLWDQGYFPQQLFYEPFLNVIIDLGVLGIAFYSLLLYGFSNLFVSLMRNSGSTSFSILISFYTLLLISSIGFFQTISTVQHSLVFLAAASMPLLIIWIDKRIRKSRLRARG